MLLFPDMKGRKAVNNFIIRDWIQTRGRKNVDYLLSQGVKSKNLTPDDKSKLLSSFKKVMSDNRSFLFQNHTLELNEKVENVYHEQLAVIAKMRLKLKG